MAIERIRIRGARGIEYSLYAGDGALSERLPPFLADLDNPHVAIITNDVVGPLYGEAVARQLPKSSLLLVPDGERHKTLATAQQLYRELLDCGADRQTVVLALGGGVIGDLAGFVAATFMRGVRLIQAPTTLLAMVDASIGGKVGVDLPEGKNLVGAFKDPVAIFQDYSVLDTLPEVEVRCGLAETIKTGLIGDADLFMDLAETPQPALPAMIARSAAVKIGIVEADRDERGERAVLNLGHTFAHAFEQLSDFTLKHGLAVGTGLHAAADLSQRLGLLSVDDLARVRNALSAHGLPLTHSYAVEAILTAMRSDKKREAGVQRFVLLEGIGKPVLHDDVPDSALRETLEALYAEA